MFLAGKLNIGSIIILVQAEPTSGELQNALDAQDFLGRLTLEGEPVEVASEFPIERLWRGRLNDREVAFKLGTLPPSKLPGIASSKPEVIAWPLAMWTTNTTATDSADHIAAGAMSLCAWAVATAGVAYYGEDGTVSGDASLAARRSMADFILASCFNLWTEFEARYPKPPIDREPALDEEPGIYIRVL